MARYPNRQHGLQHQRGFSLIEALFSALILAIALLALAGFHVGAFQDSTLVKSRMAATNLAQEKLDDLRTFTLLKDDLATTAVNECAVDTTFCFSEIATNVGGTETTTGVLALPTGSVSGFQDSFTRTWTVTCAATEPSGSALSFGTTCSNSDVAKLVTVEIKWKDSKGVDQVVSLQSVIYSMDPASGANAAVSPVSGKGPKISYTPNAESVPIDIGGGKSTETSRPLPEVSGGDSRRVTLPSVVYTGSSGSETVVAKEEFATVNCTCKLNGTGSAWTPHRTVWNGSALEQEKGEQVSKAVGQPSDLSNSGTTSQDPLCIQCCRDHHDTNATTAESGTAPGYPAYRPYASVSEFLSGTGDHKHYTAGGTQATTTSDVYYEACRMKRVDGYWRVAADWQLIDLATYGCDYFVDNATYQCLPSAAASTAKLEAYRTWLKNVLKAFVGYLGTNQSVNTASASLPTFNSGVNPLLDIGNSDHDVNLVIGANKQLITRGIYADTVFKKKSSGTPRAVDTDYVAAVLPVYASSDFSKLQYLPFYDANLTLLANWSPTSTNTNNSNNPPKPGDCSPVAASITYDTTPTPSSAVCVTSQAIQTISDPSLGYYSDFYSRGKLYGKVAGSTVITAKVARGNNGLTSSPSINGATDSVMPRQVKATIPANGTTAAVSGSITRGNSGANLANVTITASPATGVSCVFTNPGALSTASNAAFNCTVPSGWSGTLTFASSASYTFSTVTTSTITIPTTSPLNPVIVYGQTATLYGKLYATGQTPNEVLITTSTGQTCTLLGSTVSCANVALASGSWTGTVTIANKSVCNSGGNTLCTNVLRVGPSITSATDCNSGDGTSKTTGSLTAGPGDLGTTSTPSAFTFCAK